MEVIFILSMVSLMISLLVTWILLFTIESETQFLFLFIIPLIASSVSVTYIIKEKQSFIQFRDKIDLSTNKAYQKWLIDNPKIKENN